MKDKGLPIPHKELPAAPPKSLLARVEMLESAMATMCQLQVRLLPHRFLTPLPRHAPGLVV